MFWGFPKIVWNYWDIRDIITKETHNISKKLVLASNTPTYLSSLSSTLVAVVWERILNLSQLKFLGLNIRNYDIFLRELQNAMT